jgi:hypothetical protein
MYYHYVSLTICSTEIIPCQVYLSYLILTHPYQCIPRPPTDFHNVRFNFKLPFTSSSSTWSLSLTFPHQNLAYTCPRLHTCHISCPNQAALFDHPKSEEDKSWSTSLYNTLQSPAASILIDRDTFLSNLCLNLLAYVLPKIRVAKINKSVFHSECWLALAQPRRWKTTHCRLSSTAYQMCSHLNSVPEWHLLHTKLKDSPYCMIGKNLPYSFTNFFGIRF